MTTFRISHNGKQVGTARLSGKLVLFTSTDDAHFESQDHAWLTAFRAVVRRLVRGIGEWSKYSISEDIDSGIIAERL